MDYQVRQQLRELIHRAIVPDYIRERKEQQRRLVRLKRIKQKSAASSSNLKRPRPTTNTTTTLSTRPTKRPVPSTLAVDVATLKSIKNLARLAPCNVVAVHELLQEPLNANNSETRLMALLICHELFTRSKHFRQATAKQIKDFVQLTVGGKMNGDELPLPTDAAQVLRKKSIAFIEEWHDTYGVHFQSLRVAHQYMSKSLHIVFPKAKQHVIDYEQEQLNKAQALQQYKRAVLDMERVKVELENGALLEVQDHSIILENCLLMLVPGSTAPGNMVFAEYEEQHEAKKREARKGGVQEEEDGEAEEAEEAEEEEDEWIDTSDNIHSAGINTGTSGHHNDEASEDDLEESDDDEYEGDSWSLYNHASREAMNVLGIASEQFELKIHVSSIKAKIMEQTFDHRQYIEPTLIDCIRLTDTRYVPMLHEWIASHQSYLKVMNNDFRNGAVRTAAKMLKVLETTCNQVVQRTKKAKDLLCRDGNKKRKDLMTKSKSGSFIVGKGNSNCGGGASGGGASASAGTTGIKRGSKRRRTTSGGGSM
jgi:hypothetical protein